MPADSPFAGHAAMLRARLVLKRDRFAEAEELLPIAMRAQGPHAIEARETLVHLFNLQGRFAEVRRLVEDAWDTYPDRIGLLRQLASLDSINPEPIEVIRPALESAAARGRPTTTGSGWAGPTSRSVPGNSSRPGRGSTTACARRPDDAAVWKGRLDLAMATGDVAGARKAFERLLPDRVPAAELLAVPAWFAAQSGDSERERQALEELLERAPGRGPAVERLAELELLAGRPDRAAKLRARKAELDRAKTHYEILITKPSHEAVHFAAEAARLAETLGRSFEASALWSVALERKPGDREASQALARLERAGRAHAGLTLAGLLSEIGPFPARPIVPGGRRRLRRRSSPMTPSPRGYASPSRTAPRPSGRSPRR